MLRMNSSRLPKKFLLAEPKLGCKRSHGGQVMTWHRGMKESTERLAIVEFTVVYPVGDRKTHNTHVSEYPRGYG